MIRLVIFDAGGVLYSGSPETVSKAVRAFLARHGVRDFDKSDKVWSEIDRLVSVGKISLKEAQERWLEALGLDRDLLDEWEEVDRKEIWSRFKRTPGINRFLADLKKKYFLAVLSDTISDRSKKIEEMDIVGVDHEVFDEIFTSHDLGACKPSKRAFQAVLKRFDVKPAEAVFISDACDELRGARRMGLVTIGFHCDGGDYSIKSLEEIQRILQNLA